MRPILFLILLHTLVIWGCGNNSGNKNNNLAGPGNSNTALNSNTQLPPATPIVDQKPTQDVDPNFKPCNPYFPLVPGSQVKYTINYATGLVSDVNIIVEAIEENGQKLFKETTQIQDNRGGGEKQETTVRKYVCDGQKVEYLSLASDNRVQDNITRSSATFSPAAVAMMEPASLKPGTSWSYTLKQSIIIPDGRAANQDVTFSVDARGEESVTVPAGTFKTIILAKKGNQHIITENYAAGIGLVRRVNDDGTRWELKEYSGVSPAK